MNIRKINSGDKNEFVMMAKDFYNSQAVIAKVPEEYFVNTFNAIIYGYPNLNGYFMMDDKGIPVGYALTNTFWSNHSGGKEVLLDEIFIKPSRRYMGYGKEFIKWISNQGSDVMNIRLDILSQNKKTVDLYKSLGYSMCHYSVMVKENSKPSLEFLKEENQSLKTSKETLPTSTPKKVKETVRVTASKEVKIVDATPAKATTEKLWWEELS